MFYFTESSKCMQHAVERPVDQMSLTQMFWSVRIKTFSIFRAESVSLEMKTLTGIKAVR